MKQENIRSLKANQIELKLLKENYAKKLEVFEEINKRLMECIEKVSNDEIEIKGKIEIEAIAEFKETNQKKLLGGIGIRILNKLNYLEEDAIKWAKENMPVAINEVIDKKQFETFAKSSELDFVKNEEKISVTFPKEIII